MDWDVMLFIVLWAYWMTYKVTIQYTPFELVYGTQLVMSTKFAIPTKRICNIPQGDMDKAIHVRMEDFLRLDENRWQARKILTTFNCCTKNNKMIKGR
jgi:hypothetical protein